MQKCSKGLYRCLNYECTSVHDCVKCVSASIIGCLYACVGVGVCADVGVQCT